MKQFEAELVLKAGAELAEGPVWCEEEKKLYWVDINIGVLHRFDPETGKDEAFPCGEPIGTVAFRKDGGLIAALKSGIWLLDIEDGVLKKTFLVNPEPDTPNRFNDGKCDPAGRFLAGTCYTPVKDGEDILGGFYSVEPDGSSRTLIDNRYISNGLCFSEDNKTLYYVDSFDHCVAAYDYDVTDGSIKNRRIIITIDGNIPDGMTIDAEGTLWVALFGGGKVLRIDPEKGEVIAEVPVPAKKVTCPVFGGDDFSTLYITTAWENSTPEERENDPLAGSIFSVRPGVKGFPSFRFGK